ncbi:MAG: hypothetical protein D6790_01185, partial [Caldilineae bacterium]
MKRMRVLIGIVLLLFAVGILATCGPFASPPVTEQPGAASEPYQKPPEEPTQIPPEEPTPIPPEEPTLVPL